MMSLGVAALLLITWEKHMETSVGRWQARCQVQEVVIIWSLLKPCLSKDFTADSRIPQILLLLLLPVHLHLPSLNKQAMAGVRMRSNLHLPLGCTLLWARVKVASTHNHLGSHAYWAQREKASVMSSRDISEEEGGSHWGRLTQGPSEKGACIG